MVADQGRAKITKCQAVASPGGNENTMHTRLVDRIAGNRSVGVSCKIDSVPAGVVAAVVRDCGAEVPVAEYASIPDASRIILITRADKECVVGEVDALLIVKLDTVLPKCVEGIAGSEVAIS
jgi:hypothetical protein